MTAITHPLVKTHDIVAVLITAAVSVGLTVALMLAFVATGSSSSPHLAVARTPTPSGFVGTVNSGPDNPSRVESRLCAEIANGSPSPGFDRLARSITVQRSC
jgi:hypothetical protein